MHDLANRYQARHGIEQGIDRFLAAEDDEADFGTPLNYLRLAGQHHCGAVIASHGVNGYPGHAAYFSTFPAGTGILEVRRK